MTHLGSHCYLETDILTLNQSHFLTNHTVHIQHEPFKPRAETIHGFQRELPSLTPSVA